MKPGKLPSDSIKEVPGRSKLKVESSNPVARGNKMFKPSKVKLISPEEVIKLSSGANVMPVSPVQPAPSASQVPKSPPTRRTPQTPRPVLAQSTPEAPVHVPARPTPEAPRSVLAFPAEGFRKEIVCGLPAQSLTTTKPVRVRQKTNQSLLHSKKIEPPPSPRALQIRSRIKQRVANPTQAVGGIIGEASDKAKDDGFKEARHSVSAEELAELIRYLPAQRSTWNGRIMDSTTPPLFDYEFLAKPASCMTRKSLRLSKAMPTLLKVELFPACNILNNVFGRKPTLLNVQMYLFPDEKKTERFKEELNHLFEVIATHNATMKVDINGTDLLIFSSKVLDKTSQFIINTQKKTKNFLWGFFLQTKKSLARDKESDNWDVVDMDTEFLTPSVVVKLIAESQSTTSCSTEKVSKDTSLPPGFEKIWAPPLVRLNVQTTLSTDSGLTTSAGIVRDQSGKWVFGYSRCHKSNSEVAAGLLAIYHGLKLLWDSGFRRIHLETTSLEIINALTTLDLFPKRKTVLGSCKDIILKDCWECDIYHISKEENSCAEWLASRSIEQLQGLVFFEYPPRGLVDLLGKDQLTAR